MAGIDITQQRADEFVQGLYWPPKSADDNAFLRQFFARLELLVQQWVDVRVTEGEPRAELETEANAWLSAVREQCGAVQRRRAQEAQEGTSWRL